MDKWKPTISVYELDFPSYHLINPRNALLDVFNYPHDLNLCTKFVFVYTIDCHFVNCEFIQEGKYKPYVSWDYNHTKLYNKKKSGSLNRITLIKTFILRNDWIAN